MSDQKKFLDDFLDPALHIPGEWTPDVEQQLQLGRLLPAAALAELAANFPGRLPESAGRVARRNDKKTCRRVASRLRTAVAQWGPEHDPDKLIRDATRDPAVQRSAAQVEWTKWWDDYRPHLEAAMRRVATATIQNGIRKEGNKMLHRLQNEYRALEDCLFDPRLQATDEEPDDS